MLSPCAPRVSLPRLPTRTCGGSRAIAGCGPAPRRGTPRAAAALQDAPAADPADAVLRDDAQLAELCASCDLPALRRLGGPAGVLRLLGTDPARGLSPPAVAASRSRFGANTTPAPPAPTLLSFVADAAGDTTLQVLVVAALLSLGAALAQGEDGGWHDGAAILATVAVCVSLTAANNYSQALQFRGLSLDKRDISVAVTRDAGRRLTVSVYDLVVGDVVVLAQGDAVPADGLLLAGQSLLLDESSMTGESAPVAKSVAAAPFLLAGCKVAEGCGEMVVTAVGLQTEWGRALAATADSNDEQTPLQARLEALAGGVGTVGTAVAALVATSVFAHDALADPSRWPQAALGALIAGVAIVVVAVPEGLPLAVTLSLAYSLRAMADDKALVRHLSACETMGGATAICTDKTGTLTTNDMAVVAAHVGGADCTGADPAAAAAAAPAAARALAQAAFLCTTGAVADADADAGTGAGAGAGAGGGAPAAAPAAAPQVAGSPTERALLAFAAALPGVPGFRDARAAAPLLRMQPFDSARKTMGVLVAADAGAARLLWKGAPEAVLDACDFELRDGPGGGDVVRLTAARRAELASILAGYADRALRTIALASRDVAAVAAAGLTAGAGDGAGAAGAALPQPPPPLPFEGLTLLGLLGIADPLRPGAAAAVAACQAAGITVRMVTGDNAATAAAIARGCGILDPAAAAAGLHAVVEGPVFRAMSDAQRAEVAPRLRVLARSSPTDKLVLVRLLRAAGDVVAVTGDGTNDAPALREADVGLAMGIAGTEVLLDDDFASAVRVVRWGRAVRRNVQAFLQFQLTVNVVALALNSLAALSGSRLPLTAVQLLWVNLIMDSLGALALATEPPTDALLSAAPAGRGAPIVSNHMYRNIGAMAAWQLAVLLGLYFGGAAALGLDGAGAGAGAAGAAGAGAGDGGSLRTLVFNAFVFMQLFNEVNARAVQEDDVLAGLGGNRAFVAIWLATAATQAALVAFGGDFAATVPLDAAQWALCLGVGASVLPVALLVKRIPVPDAPPLPQLLLPWLRPKSA